jgi:hypothetical protein
MAWGRRHFELAVRFFNERPGDVRSDAGQILNRTDECVGPVQVRLTKSVSATFRQLFPSPRRLRASSRRKTRLGRPRRVPLAFAARTPAQTRSRMIPRSISANAANRCKRNLDMGLPVPVSINSLGLRNRMPSETSSWILRTQCATLPQRSSTSTPSNLRRRSWLPRSIPKS